MQYSTVLMMSIFVATAIGGATSFLGASRDDGAVGDVIQEARSSIRDTMRDLDGSYYRRSEAYDACAAAYGGRVADRKAPGDITLSCECFDKSIRLLGGLDRETALKGLGPAPGAVRNASAGPAFSITAAAGQILRRCDIEPWDGGMTGSLRGAI